MSDERDTSKVETSYTKVQEVQPRFGSLTQGSPAQRGQMKAALRGARKRRLQRLTTETFPPH